MCRAGGGLFCRMKKPIKQLLFFSSILSFSVKHDGNSKNLKLYLDAEVVSHPVSAGGQHVTRLPWIVRFPGSVTYCEMSVGG